MPIPSDALTLARTKIGLGESPPGSEHNEITSWYGSDGPWCAMFVSWVLAHAGFSRDNGITMFVPGVVQTTVRGWSYVPYLLNNFRDAGRAQDAPEPGDIVTYDWDQDKTPDHTGLVESVLEDGSINAIEGNHHGLVDRVHRNCAVVAAFCRVPYTGETVLTPIPKITPGVPPFSGYCSLGSQDNATRAVQHRLSDRGWHLQVDGNFGSVTANIVKSFQSANGLKVDGVVGPLTWDALWTRPIT